MTAIPFWAVYIDSTPPPSGGPLLRPIKFTHFDEAERAAERLAVIHKGVSIYILQAIKGFKDD